jgi:vanillate O-demethylase monooxygenase subunit
MTKNEPNFPLNAWYAAAWETDVSRDLFARRICNIPMVFYRKTDRSIVALKDACWHRLVPLSEGRLIGDDLMCGYHGLVFNPQGRCIHMPSQETINPSAAVRSFRVAEKHRLIWVWPGDPALADESTIPDLHWLDSPGWAAHQDYQRAACDYRLILDNLMDLTHETFLHGNSIGQAAVAEAPFDVVHGDRRVKMTRHMKDIDAPPFFVLQHRMAFGNAPTVKMNRWQEINFTAPSTISISVGVKPAEYVEHEVNGPIHGQVLNTITPETPGSCH